MDWSPETPQNGGSGEGGGSGKGRKGGGGGGSKSNEGEARHALEPLKQRSRGRALEPFKLS